jgi:hypothetical protein
MAAFFWIHAGANNNWATNGNWSATSGGGSNAAQPSVTSDVTFDGAGANGNDASTVSATQSVLSLTFTAGYTNTVTVNAVLTIAGNFTDRTNHSWAGSSAMTISASSTITSNGKTWPNGVTFSGANTKTISGDWTISGLLTISAATTITSANKIIVNGINHSAGATIGTCTIRLTGGTWTGSAGSATISNPMELAGNVTFAANIGMAGGSLTYVSGTITTASNTMLLAGNITFNTAGVLFNNVTFNGTSTLTNNSLCTINGLLQYNATFAITWAGTSAFNINNWTILTTDARTHSFVDSIQYTINGDFQCSLSRTAASVLLTSSHGTNKANIGFTNSRSICNLLADLTRIDATGARPMVTYNGAVTSCVNVFRQTDVLWRPMESFKQQEDTDEQRFKLLNKNFAVMYAN